MVREHRYCDLTIYHLMMKGSTIISLVIIDLEPAYTVYELEDMISRIETMCFS